MDVSRLLAGTGMQALFHPITYAKTLIQIGYEPMDPVQTRSFFGKKRLMYPNALKYVKNIKDTDGFFGMYRGLGPKLTEGILHNLVYQRLNKKLKETPLSKGNELDGDDDEEEEGLMKLFKDMSIEATCRVGATIASHPFHVIMVRSMAQFVGSEDIYSNSFSAIREIYNKEGILGFFAGLLPRIIGEVASIWLTNSLAFVVTNYILPKDNRDLPGYVRGVCALITSQLTYPFTLVSTVMCVNGSGLAAGQPPLMPFFYSWRECWIHLGQNNQLKRGSSLFFRYYPGPVIETSSGKLMPADPLFIN